MNFTWSRDAHGIPQISASDLRGVLEGMGYCHATDRGMQMLMMRILGWGRAAELLDPSDELVEVDRFFRRMNFARDTDLEAGKLDAETLAAAEAYCDGVNRRLKEKRLWEFRLVGYTPTPWTIEDSLMMARMTGYLTLAQSQGEIERLFVEMVQAGIPDQHLESLFPGSTAGLDRELLTQVSLREQVVPDVVRWATNGARVMASNNWCISGSKTKSGAAIMANDPHLEVNRLPNVWAEQSCTWPGGTATIVTMPGLPAPLVGRNEHLSWGATYTFMDAIDSWVEEVKDGAYRHGDAWQEFNLRAETILRKKTGRGTPEPVHENVWENEHGVLDGDPGTDGYYLATRWSGSEGGAASFNSLQQMWTARTVTEGMAAFGGLESAFNWVFADTEGNIGYQMSGRMPLRHDDWDGFAPRPGWDPAYDWQGYAAPEELPRVRNPDSGFIVTANQDLNHLGERDPINMPMGDYRARRITQVLEEHDEHDIESCRALQMDVYSLQAEAFMEILRPLLSDAPFDQCLADWNFQYDLASLGATAFEAFYAELLREMFGPECGAPVMKHLREHTGVFIDFYQNFDDVLTAKESPWHDERSREDIWGAALEKSRGTALTPWGDENQVTLTNMFFGGKLPGFLGFDHGPIALPGGRATPHQAQIYCAGERLTSFCGTVRIVADMSEPALHTALCGGPSDRRFSKWYTSGVERWRAGELIARKPT